MANNPLHQKIYRHISLDERLQQGIFFTKENTVAQIREKIDLESAHSIVDTCAGASDFLIPLATQYPQKQFYGVEKHPLVYSQTQSKIKALGLQNLHYFEGDILLDQFDIPPCDVYVGNPPFVHHSVLPEAYREQIRPLWQQYFPEQKGFDLLLGKSRSDIAQLIFTLSVDRYLKEDGQFAVILPNSLLKGQASIGFRQFKNIQVSHLTDISSQDAFEDTNRACFYIFGHKGGKTTFPVAYHIDNQLKKLHPKGSALLTLEDQTVLGKCDYVARQGINTMGANGVFFFKQKPSFDSPLLYPLLKSSDVESYSHSASYWALLPYSKKGELLKETVLKKKYPIAYQYLLSHKHKLENRRSRFVQKQWYTLFGIGKYTFAPYKVVWRGLGASRLQACIVEKEIPNQAMHCYFSTHSLDEAHYLCALLNQPEYNQQLLALNEAGAKSFGQPSSIHQLKIATYDKEDPAHQELVVYSKREHSRKNS